MKSELEIIQDNARLIADMVGADSIRAVEAFGDAPEGHTELPKVKAGDLEVRILAPKRSVEEERAILVKEIEAQALVIDQMLDTLDPPFRKKANNWFRKKKPIVNPERTLVLGERVLKRLELIKALRAL